MIKNLINNNGLLQFYRFIIVGVINSCFNYFIFIICLLTLNFHYVISGTLGFSIGALVGYQLNRNWSFKSKIDYKKGLKIYIIIQCFCLLIHNITLVSVVEFLEIKDVFSQFAGIIVTTLLNFYLIRNFVFKKL